MANWVREFLKNNPDLVKKKIRSIGLHHIAFADGRKTIWHFQSLPVNAVGADYLDSVNDGYVYGANVVYATAQSTAYGFDITNIYFRAGQVWTGSYYSVYRSFLKFDTSAIPDGDTVIQVNMKMVCAADYSATDFDVQIVKQDWSAQDPITTDNKEAAYDNCLAGTLDDNIWKNTNGIVIDTQYASGNLNCAWINKTGWTYYSLRSNRDFDNITPEGNEYLYLYTQDYATVAYRPILTVVSESPPTLLVIAELLHSQFLDTLAQLHNLVIADMLHTQTLDELILIESYLLVIQELLHTQNIDPLILSQLLLSLMPIIKVKIEDELLKITDKGLKGNG